MEHIKYMVIHKYLDWKNWCLGLYKTSIEAFATTGLTLLTSNGLDSSGISQAIGAGHIGMSWKQAICQLGIHVGIAAFMYIKAKPVPETVTETVDTQHIEKP